ncbi:hypothetical protein BN1263390061 [Stenotrophomonas maltophilia]|nr:hypothetical protein BN1263390061 [Stenotrophomonas maltophilia]
MGSTIRSQGDVSIVATAGDLNIIGSQVKGDNVALAARDNITLRSEAEDHTQSSKNNSGSGEIGFSIGAPTGWYVPASTAKGSGNGTTHVETLVDADRNLSIISEQDTDDYASKQTQADGTSLCGSERWSGGPTSELCRQAWMPSALLPAKPGTTRALLTTHGVECCGRLLAEFGLVN